MQKDPMKLTSIDTLVDKHIGKKGTENRESFEYELKLDVIGQIIKEARIKQNLTQEQLGELIGVKKAQISKLENNTKQFRIDTILKVLNALGAKLKLTVELGEIERLVIE